MAQPVKPGSRSSLIRQRHGQHQRAQWRSGRPVHRCWPLRCRHLHQSAQPNFAAAAEAANNIIFRIPTPTFGAGLIENLDDSTLLNNQAANLNNSLALPAPSTATAMTAPSPVSAGRRRTSRCTSLPVRLTTWRWASPTSCSPTNARCPEEDQQHRAAGELPEPYGNRYPEDTSNPNSDAERSGSGRRVGVCQLHAVPGSAANRWVVLNGQQVTAATIATGSPCSARSAAQPATIQRQARRKYRTSFRR
jgi:hypothetical protein